MLCAILNSLSGFRSGVKVLTSSSDLKLCELQKVLVCLSETVQNPQHQQFATLVNRMYSSV